MRTCMLFTFRFLLKIEKKVKHPYSTLVAWQSDQLTNRPADMQSTHFTPLSITAPL